MNGGSRFMRFVFFVVSLLVVSVSFASTNPLYKITLITRAPSFIKRNHTAIAVYQVRNTTPRTQTLVMEQIAGVRQFLSAPQDCDYPMVLGSNEACILKLQIIGSELKSSINRGPVICRTIHNSLEPNTLLCSQPDFLESLAVTLTPADSALFTDTALHKGIESYVSDIYNKQPNATEALIRVNPIYKPTLRASSVRSHLHMYRYYADLLTELRKTYANNLDFKVGFYVDKLLGSESDWGCSKGDWQCVFNYSIIAMNNINELVDVNQVGSGFDIYAIANESYMSDKILGNMHACLYADSDAVRKRCSVPTTASPLVKFANVMGGNKELSNTVNLDKFDYVYSHFHEITHKDQSSVFLNLTPLS